MFGVNNKNNNINPHMKFSTLEKGVISPPANIYSYSLQDEIYKTDREYEKLVGSINRKQKALFLEKHPNITNSIKGFMKVTAAIALGFATFRYRHSIPILKNFCRIPKNTPPNFLDDLSKIWQSIVKK